MKRWSLLAVIVIALSGAAFADEFKDNFQSNLNTKSLDALAKDVGALVGGGSFHQGKALGFPLGFDVGIHAPFLKLNDDDTILRDNGSSANAVWGQAEVGLPLNINVLARYGKLFDATLVGGGLRWGVFTSKVPGVPSVSISGLYNELNHDYFKATTYTGNLALSIDLPFVHPYIGVGYDKTNLDTKSAAYNGLAPTVAHVDGSGDGYRAEIGVNLSLIPFTYITLGGGLANGQTLYHAGAGVSF